MDGFEWKRRSEYWQWSSRWKTICRVLRVRSSIKRESLVYKTSLAFKETENASSDLPILSKTKALSARAYGEFGYLERRAVQCFRAFLNCRESIASQIGRTLRSGIPPAKPNFDAIPQIQSSILMDVFPFFINEFQCRLHTRRPNPSSFLYLFSFVNYFKLNKTKLPFIYFWAPYS